MAQAMDFNELISRLALALGIGLLFGLNAAGKRVKSARGSSRWHPDVCNIRCSRWRDRSDWTVTWWCGRRHYNGVGLFLL